MLPLGRADGGASLPARPQPVRACPEAAGGVGWRVGGPVGRQVGALKLNARDHWIGWLPAQQYRRLHLITNNTRFLMLFGVQISKLAIFTLAQLGIINPVLTAALEAEMAKLIKANATLVQIDRILER